MVPFFDGLDVLGHVVGHEFVELVSHAGVSFIGWDSVDWSLEMA
jgi:hypothetical protein